MDKNHTIELLEAEATKVRTSYEESGGVEWVRLVITLKALIEEYTLDKKFDKVAILNKEIDEVLVKIQEQTVIPLNETLMCETVNTYYDEISEWASKAERYKNELSNGGSFINYANSISALCEYLCLAKQYKIALLNYKEALHILLSNSTSNCSEHDCFFNIIVMLLKASTCALKINDSSLSKYFVIYSMKYLIENISKWKDIPLTSWNYIAELCSRLIPCQVF